MNKNDKRIDHVLGGYGAGALVNAWIDALVTDDHLDRRAAIRIACERVADFSPWLVAAPGQTWRLRPEFTPTTDFAPALIHIVAVRRAHGTHGIDGKAAALVTDAEHSPRETIGWMDLDDLALQYAIDDWPHPRVPRIPDDGVTLTLDSP